VALVKTVLKIKFKNGSKIILTQIIVYLL